MLQLSGRAVVLRLSGRAFRLVHLDMDSYEPTAAAMRGLLRRKLVDEATVFVADEAVGVECFLYIELRAIFDVACEHGLALRPLFRGRGSEYCNCLRNQFIDFHRLKSGAALEEAAPTARSLAFRLVPIGGRV